MRSRKKYPVAMLLGIPLFLYLDSPYFQNHFEYAQTLATILVIIAFYRSYSHSSKRVQFVMITGVFVGFAGEILFSLVFGMYHYRFGNIPLWVGFGHSLIYSSVYQLIRYRFVLEHQRLVKIFLISFVVLYTLFWFYKDNDLFGLLTTIGFLILLVIAKKSQIFFLVMFLVVAYIEQVGTTTLTWYWPTTLMSYFENIPSGNPPSGIAIFYFLFDYIVLHIYMLTHKSVTKRWKNV